MSLLAISMDLFLAALMIAALVMGVRLNGRLKALRSSHEGFARAIVELNDAAVRAEKGLAGLREAATETHDSLLARIETARSLSSRLDGQIQAARALIEAEGLTRRAPPVAAGADIAPAVPYIAPSPPVAEPPEAIRRLAERFGVLPPSHTSARPGRPDAPARRGPPAQPAKPARRPPPGEEELFEPALVDGRLRLARVDRTVPDDPRDTPLTAEDFAARIRARKAEL